MSSKRVVHPYSLGESHCIHIRENSSHRVIREIALVAHQRVALDVPHEIVDLHTRVHPQIDMNR